MLWTDCRQVSILGRDCQQIEQLSRSFRHERLRQNPHGT
jgi:hypothetical protein